MVSEPFPPDETPVPDSEEQEQPPVPDEDAPPEDAPAEDEDGASGVPEAEDEGDPVADAVKEFLAEHGEQAIDFLPDDVKAAIAASQPSEDQIADYEAMQVSQAFSQQYRNLTSEATGRYGSLGIKNQYDQLAGELVGYIQSEVKAIAEGRKEDIDLSTEAIAQHFAQPTQAGIATWLNQSAVDARGGAVTALFSHAAFRHLTAQDKQTLGQVMSQPGLALGQQIAAVMQIGLDAALRAAPENVSRKAQQDAEALLKKSEAYAKLMEYVGNGKGQKARAGGLPAGGKKYSQMTMEERMTLTPEQRDSLTRQSFRR